MSLIQTMNGDAFTICPRCSDIAEFIDDALMISGECGYDSWGFFACAVCSDIMIIDPINSPRRISNTESGNAQWSGYITSVLSVVPQFLYGFFATKQINQYDVIQFARLVNNVSHGRQMCCIGELDPDLRCEIARQMLRLNIYYCASADTSNSACDHFYAFDESRRNIYFRIMQRTTFAILPLEIRLHILDYCRIVVHERDFREKYIMNLEIILCTPYFISAMRAIFGNYEPTESGPIYVRCLSICGKGFTYRITGESLENII